MFLAQLARSGHWRTMCPEMKGKNRADRVIYPTTAGTPPARMPAASASPDGGIYAVILESS